MRFSAQHPRQRRSSAPPATSGLFTPNREAAVLLDTEQQHDGPTLRTIRTGEISRIGNTAAGHTTVGVSPWPEYRAACRVRSVGSVAAFPIAIGGDTVGALTIVSHRATDSMPMRFASVVVRQRAWPACSNSGAPPPEVRRHPGRKVMQSTTTSPLAAPPQRNLERDVSTLARLGNTAAPPITRTLAAVGVLGVVPGTSTSPNRCRGAQVTCRAPGT